VHICPTLRQNVTTELKVKCRVREGDGELYKGQKGTKGGGELLLYFNKSQRLLILLCLAPVSVCNQKYRLGFILQCVIFILEQMVRNWKVLSLTVMRHTLFENYHTQVIWTFCQLTYVANLKQLSRHYSKIILYFRKCLLQSETRGIFWLSHAYYRSARNLRRM